jgi:hypothetical protein
MHFQGRQFGAVRHVDPFNRAQFSSRSIPQLRGWRDFAADDLGRRIQIAVDRVSREQVLAVPGMDVNAVQNQWLFRDITAENIPDEPLLPEPPKAVNGLLPDMSDPRYQYILDWYYGNQVAMLRQIVADLKKWRAEALQANREARRTGWEIEWLKNRGNPPPVPPIPDDFFPWLEEVWFNPQAYVQSWGERGYDGQAQYDGSVIQTFPPPDVMQFAPYLDPDWVEKMKGQIASASQPLTEEQLQQQTEQRLAEIAQLPPISSDQTFIWTLPDGRTVTYTAPDLPRNPDGSVNWGALPAEVQAQLPWTPGYAGAPVSVMEPIPQKYPEGTLPVGHTTEGIVPVQPVPVEQTAQYPTGQPVATVDYAPVPSALPVPSPTQAMLSSGSLWPLVGIGLAVFFAVKDGKVGQRRR